MKFTTLFCLVVAFYNHAAVQAWLVASRQTRWPATTSSELFMTKIHSPSQAERHLEEMQQRWQNLQAREREVEASNDKQAAIVLTQEILQTAIEFVQTKELVEKERALQAHEILQDTISEEHALLMAYAKNAHQDALDAEEALEKYYTHHVGNALDERREQDGADISHQVERYLESRLAQIQDRETKFVMDEIQALKSYDELKHMEENLQSTLEAIRASNLGQQGTNVP